MSSKRKVLYFTLKPEEEGVRTLLGKETKKKVRGHTSIATIYMKKEGPKTFSFLDYGNNEHICKVSMVDLQNESYPKVCFWDRNRFVTDPIGLPVKYEPTKLIRTYRSQITNELYTIKESVTPEKRDRIIKEYTESHNPGIDEGYTIEENNYYVTDGCFCSFECCIAFLEANSHNPLYSHSKSLLNLMYVTTYGRVPSFSPASSWRMLEDYGGTQTVEEFRSNFHRIVYSEVDTIIPESRTMAIVYEEKAMF